MLFTEVRNFDQPARPSYIYNVKMSFMALPNEIIIQIIDSLDKSDPKKSFNIQNHRQMIKALMALRLTSKLLGEIALPQLFKTFCLLPSLESWLKLCYIATIDNFGKHLETLALERQHEGTYTYKAMMRHASASSKYCHLDLSLLPNLKIIKAEDKWLLTKKPRSQVKIPPEQSKIHAISFANCKPAIWSVLGDLTEISNYNFEISSLNCYLGACGPWQTLLSMDFSGLKYLRLASDGYYSNRYRYNLLPDIELLTKLQRLPNLEAFHLDQYFFGREEASASTVNYTTNVIKLLLEKDWPRLRHLDLRYLTTTTADFQEFVAPHAGTLASFQMHSGIVCAKVTEEERLQRFYLPHWIRTVVCPPGGGTTFEHYGGQPEGFYETPEDYEQHSVMGRAGDVEGEDIIMGDYEDVAELVYFEQDSQGDIIMAEA